MKKFIAILGACMLFGMSGVASAYTLSYGGVQANGGFSSALAGAQVDTFDGSAFSLTWGAGSGAITTGSVPSVAAAPYGPLGADQTRYAAVTGSQTFSLPGLSNYLGLWWGSVDSYNSITFLKGGVATGDTVVGNQISSPADGNWTNSATNLYVNISGLSAFDGFTLTSGTPAFEVDNIAVAPVPEPGTMMLLGAGFLGLAIYGKRRKNS